MIEGALLIKDSNGSHCAGKWLEGAPQWSIWGLKTRNRQVLPVESFRCERCGYLESYAERIDNPAPRG